MKRTLLALSIQMVVGASYAAETELEGEADLIQEVESATASNRTLDNPDQESEIVKTTSAVESNVVADQTDIQPAPSFNKDETPSLVPQAEGQAANALQQKEGDATQETNLQEVFTSSERQYSLIKRGEISAFYDLDYSYYRDA